MFMTTTLAHYQLPLFGVAASALQTEIGADARSIFSRPITAISPSTELPSSAIVQPVEAPVRDVQFRTWMETVKRYETTANNGNGASEPISEGEPATADGAQPEPGASTPETVEPAPQGQMAEPSQQAPQAASPQSDPANEAPAPVSDPAGKGSSGSSQASSGNRGSLLGGVIRY